MRYVNLFLIYFWSLTSLFSQTDIDEKKRIDSLYTAYSKLTTSDPDYENAIHFRNEYGWSLNKKESLKADISAILELPSYRQKELTYNKIFNPQDFPPSEWEQFYQISDELYQFYPIGSRESTEMLGIKTLLEFLTINDSALVIDLPILLDMLNNNSKVYYELLWQYANGLSRQHRYTEAISLFEKGYSKTNDIKFFKSIIEIYSLKKEYVLIKGKTDDILQDKSGVLLFDLGRAYLETGNIDSARFFFDLYSTYFVYTDENAIRIPYGNYLFSIEAEQFEIMGDVSLDKKQACKYIIMAEKILKQPEQNSFFYIQLNSIRNEKRKQELLNKEAQLQLERLGALKRIQEKVEKCN